MLDETDHKILALLSENGRMTWAELAKFLGLSSPSTAERVRHLEEKGVIKGYHASLHYEALGCSLLAFVFLYLAHPKYCQNFKQALTELPEVQECHHITGDEDYLLKVRCRDTQHLDEFLNQRLKKIPGIVKTKTTISLSTLKDRSDPLLIPKDHYGM